MVWLNTRLTPSGQVGFRARLAVPATMAKAWSTAYQEIVRNNVLNHATLGPRSVVSINLSRIQSVFSVSDDNGRQNHYLRWAERAGERLLEVFAGVTGRRNQLTTGARTLRWAERARERLLEIFAGVTGCRNQLTTGARTLRRAADFSLAASVEESCSRAGAGRVRTRNKRRQS